MTATPYPRTAPDADYYALSPRYTRSEVAEASLAYFEGDDMAADVFVQKYALRDDEGNFLERTPEDMHRRVARELARVDTNQILKTHVNTILDEAWQEKWQERYEYFYGYLAHLVEDPETGEVRNEGYGRVVVQGSPMSAIGNPFQLQTASNCYVIASPHDSYCGIGYTDLQLANLMKRRGGVGVDVSTLRPANTPTRNAAKTSDGVCLFMERFSNTCREVAQNGRRGAEMMMISCHHPDIRQFIELKRDKERKNANGANISIRFSREFHDALKSDGEYELRFPVQAGLPDDAYTFRKGVPAKEIWDEFVQSAWECAEPGAAFWDIVEEDSPSDIYAFCGFGSICTNPCGEIVLSANDSCRLTALNLWRFVVNPFSANGYFDYDSLYDAASVGQYIMDLIVTLDAELVQRIIEKVKADPEPDHIKAPELAMWEEIRRVALTGRRTGLGYTALGDAMAATGPGIRYGSPESIEFTESVTRTISLASFESSVDMAKQFGPFVVCDVELERGHVWIERHLDAFREMGREDVIDAYYAYGRRNISTTTIAPTGTVSIQTQTTSGIEPAFMLYYTRRRKISDAEIANGARVDHVDHLGDRWQEYTVFHPCFAIWIEQQGHDPASLTNDQIKELAEQSPYHKATAMDQDWESGVLIQAAAQKWISHSISRTANLPADAPAELVDRIYRMAWEHRCKGYTVYREGSRGAVLMASDQSTVAEDTMPATDAPRRPDVLPCDVHRVSVKGEAWTVLVGLYEDRPYEVFATPMGALPVPPEVETAEVVKHTRKHNGARYELRWETSGGSKNVRDIAKTMEAEHNKMTRMVSLSLRHGAKIQYVVEQLGRDDGMFNSLERVLARVLKKYIPEGTPAGSMAFADCDTPENCKPVYTEGCLSCLGCGKSKCG